MVAHKKINWHKLDDIKYIVYRSEKKLIRKISNLAVSIIFVAVSCLFYLSIDDSPRLEFKTDLELAEESFKKTLGSHYIDYKFSEEGAEELMHFCKNNEIFYFETYDFKFSLLRESNKNPSSPSRNKYKCSRDGLIFKTSMIQ